MNPAIKWFGDDFKKLHPLLQDLHLHGGSLSGVVDIEFGTGVSGFVGRCLAKKLGMPTHQGSSQLEVTISHDNNALLWERRFNEQHKVVSLFVPHGLYPDGYWIETTGILSLTLGVDIKDGGWFWVQRSIRLFGVLLPLWLFPSSQAYKRINNGMYEFSVIFSLPYLGRLVSYSGCLNSKITAISRAK